MVSRLEKALDESVASAEFKAQGEEMGFSPAFMPANEFGPLDFQRRCHARAFDGPSRSQIELKKDSL